MNDIIYEAPIHEKSHKLEVSVDGCTLTIPAGANYILVQDLGRVPFLVY